jgi:hypothetical protein
MSKDISILLNGWEYNSNEVTVRKIMGADGREKIQMRLDLGVLQMETEGRPDGKRPHNCECLLEYYSEKRLRDDELGQPLALSGDECAEIKQEAMQFYYRYLSLFHLGDYYGVLRDTQRNLRAFDLIRECAADDAERLALEQFRPYVLMMNTRACACISLEERSFDLALDQIGSGVERIEGFFREIDREELIEGCREISFLEDWAERIRTNRPLSPAERLRRDLRMAVEAEDYERAAQLRDEIKEMAIA